MRIVSSYNEEWEKKYLCNRIGDYEIQFLDGILQDHDYIRDDEAEVLSVFVKSVVGAREMDQFPKLKAIVTRSTGFDHIDLKEAKKRGISVSNVPTYGENTVAEYVFALLLTISRCMFESYERILKTGKFSPDGLRGFDLKGKTLGVVGTGHIGANVIRIAKGFDMNVIACSVQENEELSQALGFTYVNFDELLGCSDVITFHVPYNDGTHHMINVDNINKIKRGAYLINTARGGIVQTKALLAALEQGILRGAGLDVLEEEGYMQDDMELLTDPHPNPESLQTVLTNQYLIDHPRVIIVPHNAFNTKEAIERILDTTAANIKAAANDEPINLVGV